MSESMKGYQNDEEIKAVVRGFEECTTPPSQFDHRAHLTVAFAYLHLMRLPVPAATARMRDGLYRYLDHNGPDRKKYNETITEFWIRLVRACLDRLDTARSLAELANETLSACGDSHVIFAYYSKERLVLEEARNGWVEPDLKSVGFESALPNEFQAASSETRNSSCKRDP